MQKQKFDEIVSYFNKKVSEMEIETKYKMELLGMVTALGCAHEKETHEKRTETHACENTCEIERKSNDMISRQDAIDIVMFECGRWTGLAKEISKQLKQLPSAQTDLSEYSDNLWRNAYERGKRDAQSERKTAKWINEHWDGDSNFRIDGRGNCWYVRECSNCHEEIAGKPTKYCPNCGCRMLEEGGEHES